MHVKGKLIGEIHIWNNYTVPQKEMLPFAILEFNLSLKQNDTHLLMLKYGSS